jgi:hypothetical protein
MIAGSLNLQSSDDVLPRRYPCVLKRGRNRGSGTIQFDILREAWIKAPSQAKALNRTSAKDGPIPPDVLEFATVWQALRPYWERYLRHVTKIASGS